MVALSAITDERDESSEGATVVMMLSQAGAVSRETQRVERAAFARCRRTAASVTEPEAHTNLRLRNDQPSIPGAPGFSEDTKAGNGSRFGGDKALLMLRQHLSPHSFV